jgi:class 3 adenylate cyclase
MVAAGVPTRRSDHAAAIVGLAFEMQEATNRFAQVNDLPWTIRIGIHSGEVVAGVIGKRKFSYDLWGDTVNVASRIESTGAAGEVRISTETASELNGHYRLSEPTRINLRGHGSHDIVTVLGKA